MKRILTERSSQILLVIGLFILLIGIVLFLWNEWAALSSEKINADKVGQFGDFIGGFVGSIWALAGVILFYVALTEQRKDFETNNKVLKAQTKALELQTEEFKFQKEELAETREVFKIQSETLKKQQFESTFFNLLNLHHELVNSIETQVSYNSQSHTDRISYLKKEKELKKITGRNCFVEFKDIFIQTYKSNKNEKSNFTEFELVEASYESFYKEKESDLGHYFRNLYHIFKFIKNSNITDKSRYTSLVRAQLSNDELFLLFYNCITINGKEKFAPLINEFHLLKNLNINSFILDNNHKNFYNDIAFG